MSHPWEQQEDESSKAYVAFCGYRNLGLERSIMKAYDIYRELEPGQKPARTTPAFFAAWSSKYNWVQRAKLYDAHIEDLKAQVIETEAAKEAQKWAARHAILREQEFEVGQRLIEAAQEMLEYPLIRTEEKQDGRLVIVMPADWKPSDAVQFLQAASKLGRLAIGTHTDQIKQDADVQVMKIGDKEIKF